MTLDDSATLLAGIATCAMCGATVSAVAAGGSPRYACGEPPHLDVRGTCEGFVSGWVMSVLRDQWRPAAISPDVVLADLRTRPR